MLLIPKIGWISEINAFLFYIESRPTRATVRPCLKPGQVPRPGVTNQCKMDPF